jgi:hypothetical protein
MCDKDEAGEDRFVPCSGGDTAVNTFRVEGKRNATRSAMAEELISGKRTRRNP